MTGSWNELMLHFRLLSEHVMTGSWNELMHHFRLLRVLGESLLILLARPAVLAMSRLFC